MIELEKLISDIEIEDWDSVINSKLQFVRSQDHLAVNDAGANGWVLSAFEVAKYYQDKLAEILEYGVASLPCNVSEPAKSIKEAREALGFTVNDVSKFARVSIETVEDAENSKTRTPIKKLQQIAQVLDIDDAKLSISPSSEDNTFSYRLRSFNQDNVLNKGDVLAFSEAAWIAHTQLKIESWLKITPDLSLDSFEKCTDYGNPQTPAWQIGYELADKAREILDINHNEIFLRETCEKLGVPIIQTELSKNIAGATISSGGARAIVVANDNRHNDVFIRRMTIAHELGHLLWDTDERLNSLQIDCFDEIAADPQTSSDKYVEQRANAFAVQFIAPIESSFGADIEDDQELITRAVEEFGLSVTSAVYHLNNKISRNVSQQRIATEDLDRGSWEGKESYGIDLFPIQSVPISRRGLFAYRIVKAYQKNLISEVTASSYLQCSSDEFLNIISFIEQMYEE